MRRRPPRSPLPPHSFPTRRPSDLDRDGLLLDVVQIRQEAVERGHLLLERLNGGRQWSGPRGHGRAMATQMAHDHMDKRYGLSRSEEHTSELQSLMRISYAVFCLNKKNTATIKILKHYITIK